MEARRGEEREKLDMQEGGGEGKAGEMQLTQEVRRYDAGVRRCETLASRGSWQLSAR